MGVKKKQEALRKTAVNWGVFIALLVAVWWLAALSIDNEVICPSPWLVGQQMAAQVSSPGFSASVGATIGRALLAMGLSCGLALPLALIAAFFHGAGEMINRLVSVLQTIPNICYVILLLFWTTREYTVLLTGAFLLFPMGYRTFYEHLRLLIKTWSPVWTVYPQPKRVLMGRICLPMLQPAFKAALKSMSSLAFKVCVTSEILTGLATGVGKSMQLARLDLNLAGVLAWSVWLVILVFLFEAVWDWMLDRLFA